MFSSLFSGPVAQHTAKRRKMSYQQLKTLQTTLKKVSGSSEEAGESLQRPKIELKVPTQLVSQSEEGVDTVVTYMAPASSSHKEQAASSSQKEQPVASPADEAAAVQPEEEEEGEDFVSLSELNSNRLTEAG